MAKSAKKPSKKPKKPKQSPISVAPAPAPRYIGLLHSGAKDRFVAPVAALRSNLPNDVEIVERYAGDLPGDLETNLKYLAAGLVRDATSTGSNKLRAIVAAGGPRPAQILRDLTRNLNPRAPIVFTTVVNPAHRDIDLVNDERRPGRNLTGMAGQTSELNPDRLHLLFALANLVRGDKIGVLQNPKRPGKGPQHDELQKKADDSRLRLVLRPYDASNLAEIKSAFAVFSSEPVKGVLVTADALFNDLRKEVVELANQAGLPTIYQWKEFVDIGGLMSFGPDIIEAYAKAGEFVTKILNGANPATMACSRPQSFKLYVNRNTARQQLGLTTLPASLLNHPVNPV